MWILFIFLKKLRDHRWLAADNSASWSGVSLSFVMVIQFRHHDVCDDMRRASFRVLPARRMSIYLRLLLARRAAEEISRCVLFFFQPGKGCRRDNLSRARAAVRWRVAAPSARLRSGQRPAAADAPARL